MMKRRYVGPLVLVNPNATELPRENSGRVLKPDVRGILGFESQALR
jgi:hypothetical protein